MTNDKPILTSAQVAGRYLKQLIAEGVPGDLAERIVFDAMARSHEEEIVVSRGGDDS